MHFLLFLALGIALGHEPHTKFPLAPARTVLPCGALKEVLRLNGGKVPRSKEEWEAALEKFGFDRTEVSFSNGLGRSSLLEPRYLYRITMRNDPDRKLPNLADKLFIAVGTSPDGKPAVEALSFNPLNPQGGFDFLSYEGQEAPHVDPPDKCARCHTNHGPIFPVAPWSSTRSATVNFVAFIHRIYQEDKEKYKEVYDELERMRKDPKANEMVEIPNSAGLRIKSFIAEMERNPIFAKTKYQGVPILRDGFRGAAGLDTAAIATNDALVFHQALIALAPERRRDFLSSAVRNRIEGALGSLLSLERKLPEGADAKFMEKVPALTGALYHDRNHVTGKVEKDPNAFPMSEGPPTDKEIQAVLDYDKSRVETFRKGLNPLPPGFAPSNVTERIPDNDRFKTVGDVRNSITFDIDPLLMARVVRESAEAVMKKHPGDFKEIQGKLLTAALEGEPLQQLYSRNFVPSGNDLTHAFIDGLDLALRKDHGVDFLKDYPRNLHPDLSAEDCYEKAQEAAGTPVNQCARCHGPSTPLFRYVSDLPRWENDLKEKDEAAVSWLKNIYKRVLIDKDMPPKREANADLVKFLKRHQGLLEN